MWVARDKYRGLHLFTDKPTRNRSTLRWESNYDSLEIDFNSFDELSWDDEPIEIELIKKTYTHSDVCIGCHNENCDNCCFNNRFKD